MPYADRKKRLEYQRNWNKNYYQRNKLSERKRVVKRKKEIAKWFEDYKSQLVCKVCGERTVICLDFHHLDGKTKDFSLGLARNWGWGIKRLKSEIEKCIVLCANCHRKAHAGIN